MTTTFVTVDNEQRFNLIKSYFDNKDVEMEEFIDGSRHQLTVSCDSFSVSGKMAARLIKQVENIFGNYDDVEIY